MQGLYFLNRNGLPLHMTPTLPLDPALLEQPHTTEMDQNELDLQALDEAQYLLKRMPQLAEHSVSDNCLNSSRLKLQKGFELLHALLDQKLELHQKRRQIE